MVTEMMYLTFRKFSESIPGGQTNPTDLFSLFFVEFFSIVAKIIWLYAASLISYK